MKNPAFLPVITLLLITNLTIVESKRKAKKQVNVAMREKKQECRVNQCNHLLPLEAQNCINECISPVCYRKTYAEPICCRKNCFRIFPPTVSTDKIHGLEDGEINADLANSFTNCARRELRMANSVKKASGRKAVTSNKPVDAAVFVESNGESQPTFGVSLSEGSAREGTG